MGLLDENRPATLRTNLVTGETTPPRDAVGVGARLREGDWFIEPFRRPRIW